MKLIHEYQVEMLHEAEYFCDDASCVLLQSSLHCKAHEFIYCGWDDLVNQYASAIANTGISEIYKYCKFCEFVKALLPIVHFAYEEIRLVLIRCDGE